MDIPAVVAAFTEAVVTTFRDSAGTDAVPSGVGECEEPTTGVGVSAVLTLRFENGSRGCALLAMADEVAAAVAGRVLAGVPGVDAALIEDCAGELINVIGGQAKTILAGTPEHFTISTPRVYNESGHAVEAGSPACQWLDFVSDAGPFVVRVYPG